MGSVNWWYLIKCISYALFVSFVILSPIWTVALWVLGVI